MKADFNQKDSTIERGNGLIYNQVANDLVLDPSSSGTHLRLEVISGSMVPFLRPGDKVLVQRSEPKSIQIGDLIVARRKGEFITHRLVNVGKNVWYTKGDRCRYLDPPLSEEIVLGKVVEIDRAGRNINLQTNYWRLLNFLLGRLNWWEVHLFLHLRKVRDIIRKRTKIRRS